MLEDRLLNNSPSQVWPELRTSDVDQVTDWAWRLPRKSWNEAAKVLLKALQDDARKAPERQLAAAALQALPPHGAEDPDSGCWDSVTVRSVITGLSTTMSRPHESELLAACMTASLPFARRAWFDLDLLHRFHAALNRAQTSIATSEQATRYKEFLQGFSEDLDRLRIRAIPLKPRSKKGLSKFLEIKGVSKADRKTFVKKSIRGMAESLRHGVIGKLEEPSAGKPAPKVPTRRAE